MAASIKMIRIELKHESKDVLLVWVWHNDRAYPTSLHVRSQLFMVMLMGKSCQTLVTQALLLNPLCAEQMTKFCGCRGKFAWFDTQAEDCDVNREPKLWRAVEDFTA
jgi:hypothetical protein